MKENKNYMDHKFFIQTGNLSDNAINNEIKDLIMDYYYYYYYYLKKFFQVIIILVLIILIMGYGEMLQYVNSIVDNRAMELNRWANSDNERLHKINDFTNKCLKSKMITKEESELIKEPRSIDMCAKEYGYDELAEIIRNADNNLKSLAFPLSLFSVN